MSGYIDLAEYQPQSSHPDKKKRQNGFFDLSFWRNQVFVPKFFVEIAEPKISEIRNSQKHKILEKLGGL